MSDGLDMALCTRIMHVRNVQHVCVTILSIKDPPLIHFRKGLVITEFLQKNKKNEKKKRRGQSFPCPNLLHLLGWWWDVVGEVFGHVFLRSIFFRCFFGFFAFFYLFFFAFLTAKYDKYDNHDNNDHKDDNNPYER